MKKQMTLQEVIVFIEGCGCPKLKEKILYLYRIRKKKKSTLLEVLEAIPLKRALQMGIVRRDQLMGEVKLEEVFRKMLATLYSK